MINFSAISQDSLLGKFLRGILKLIPKNAVLPILQGKLKGKKWIIGSGVFGYWLGTYELEKQKLFGKIVKKGDVVYDVGAHVGFYTLLAAELVGPNGKVFAFEPLPRNIFYLKKHIKINKCNNVEIIEAAVSDKEGETNFLESESTTSRLDQKGSLKVKTVSLDNLWREGKVLPPDLIKIDVEGAELEVLKGAKDLIETKKPTIFLSVHTKDIRKKCHQFLMMNGYNLDGSTEDDLLIAKK